MNWIYERFAQFGRRPVAVSDAGTVSYDDFVHKISEWRAALSSWGVMAGDRVGLVSDYQIGVVALIQALVDSGCIVIPLSEDDVSIFDERLRIAGANKFIELEHAGEIEPATAVCRTLEGERTTHPLLESMVQAGRAGFVIFTSGSTGKAKAVLLDFARLTAKFRSKVRESFRTLLFLKPDHMGGLNTLFTVLYNGGTIVTCGSRSAKEICSCIEKFKVELLPTTPSFLTMLLMSGTYRHHDLSSLKVMTYGAEVMPQSTLAGLHQVFPRVPLKQMYGLSEFGILATQSKESSSKWMKIGGAGFDLKVKNGTLWIKSEHAMLGYLNAPSPFDADGWYDTGDRVEVDGDYIQVLGRESEIINVAGEKVFPAEVENFLLTLDNVKDVIVREKKSPVVGHMIWAEFLLDQDEDAGAFKTRILEACRRHLTPFKVPGFITIAHGTTLAGSRFKKIRRTAAPTADSIPTAADPIPAAADSTPVHSSERLSLV